MASNISYEDRTLNSANPLTRFAHRSRYKLSLELSDRLLPSGGKFVDFGAGQGTFLAMFANKRPDAQLAAIEPYMTITHPQFTRVDTIRELADGSIDLLGAFEVLEHLAQPLLEDFLAEVCRVLKPGGRLLITVPIMYGLALPVKEVSGIVRRRGMGDTGPLEMARATLGLPITPTCNPLTSRKGFDWRRLKTIVASSFALSEVGWSPFAALPWWCNSQAVLVASRRED